MPFDTAVPYHVTRLYVFTVVNLILMFHASYVDCNVYVVRCNHCRISQVSEYRFNSLTFSVAST